MKATPLLTLPLATLLFLEVIPPFYATHVAVGFIMLDLIVSLTQKQQCHDLAFYFLWAAAASIISLEQLFGTIPTTSSLGVAVLIYGVAVLNHAFINNGLSRIKSH